MCFSYQEIRKKLNDVVFQANRIQIPIGLFANKRFFYSYRCQVKRFKFTWNLNHFYLKLTLQFKALSRTCPLSLVTLRNIKTILRLKWGVGRSRICCLLQQAIILPICPSWSRSRFSQPKFSLPKTAVRIVSRKTRGILSWLMTATMIANQRRTAK